MKFLLDTANLDSIQEWLPHIDGVTTNPLHLKNENMDNVEWLNKFIDRFKSQIPTDFKVFIQIEKYHKFGIADLNVIWKISMYRPGFELAKRLMKQEQKVCGTTIYDLAQLNFVLENDFDFSMVYYHKNENKQFLYEALHHRSFFETSKTKLCAASFRTKEEIIEAMKSGIEYATVRPEHLETFYQNRQVAEDYKELYE